MSDPTDEQLHHAIDTIYDKYDVDRSGTLEGDEVYNLINDAFKSLNRGREVSQQEIQNFVVAIDKNGDGKISKGELFVILKQIVNSM